MKQGQVTIFIIIGIILLAVFGTLFFLSNSTKLDSLKTQSNQLNNAKFNQQAIRVFVNDCLQDSLEHGLQLIGQQGTLWDTDVVGGVSFNDENGIAVSTDQGEIKVFYGIKKEDIDSAQYPCIEEGLCQYTFPQTDGVQFGDRQKGISPSQIKGNLRRYMTEQVLRCVKDWQQEELEDATNLVIEDEKILIYFTKDGISVDASIPISLELDGQSGFQISEFDFFYPTEFVNFVSVALHPMLLDQKSIGFDFSEDVVQGDETFSAPTNLGFPYECEDGDNDGRWGCKYFKSPDWERLNISMQKKENTPVQGVDLYEFTSQNVRPIRGEYVFRFARQNRPPALDYVGRNMCEGSYDYLVIPGDDNLGGLNIELNAYDPDEDAPITYILRADDDNSEKFYKSLDPDISDASFIVPEIGEEYIGPYVLHAIAQDNHGLEDSQEINLLVDRPLTLDMSFDIPGYMIKKQEGSTVSYQEYTQNQIFISKEDPVKLSVTYPQHSSYITNPTLSLEYGHEESEFTIEELQLTPSPNAPGSFELWFPWNVDSTRQGLDKYNTQVLGGSDDFIEVWGQLLDPTQNTEKSVLITTQNNKLSFREPAINKDLTLTFKGAYCAQEPVDSARVSKISVVGCLPHVNPDRPYPYPNHNKDISGNLLPPINPFLATHACCNPTTLQPYEYYENQPDKNTICYRDPQNTKTCAPDNNVAGGEGYTAFTSGEVQYCSGNRGNICDGPPGTVDLEPTGLCGDPNTDTGCIGNSACANKEPWTLQTGDDPLWCGGRFGCGEQSAPTQVCTTELVEGNVPWSNIEQKTTEEKRQFFKNAQATCGCNDPGENNALRSCFNLGTGELGRCRDPNPQGDDGPGFRFASDNEAILECIP